jgi:hypothetical protein
MFNITLSGKMEIPHKLDEDKDISFVCKRAGLKNIIRKPQTVDGTEEDITYKFQNLEEITILQEDKVVFGKPKKGSQSQVLRYAISDFYNQQLSGSVEYEDVDDFYKKEMSELIDKYKSKLI